MQNIFSRLIKPVLNPCAKADTDDSAPTAYADWTKLSSFSSARDVTQKQKEAVKARWRSAIKQEIYSVFNKSSNFRAHIGAYVNQCERETYLETEDTVETGKDTGGTRRTSLRGGGRERGSWALLVALLI